MASTQRKIAFGRSHGSLFVSLKERMHQRQGAHKPQVEFHSVKLAWSLKQDSI